MQWGHLFAIETASPLPAPSPALHFLPPQLEARLAALMDTCTYAVFSFARRGLFDRDKLVFTTLLATSVMLRVCRRGKGWAAGAVGEEVGLACYYQPAYGACTLLHLTPM